MSNNLGNLQSKINKRIVSKQTKTAENKIMIGKVKIDINIRKNAK
jgi:hypothetical protein